MDGMSVLSRLQAPVAELYGTLVELFPRFVVAIALTVVGWLAGRLARWLAERLIGRLSRLRTTDTVSHAVRAAGVETLAREVGGRIVFWTVFVLFVAAAGEVLGLSVVSRALGGLVRYLPSVLAAALIVIAGLVLANLARGAIGSLSTAAGIDARLPAQMVRHIILFIAVVLALDQIGIESTLLILAATILLAAGAGSVALAVGLGARGEVANLIALHYVASHYAIGQRVCVGEVAGLIVGFRRNGVVLDSPTGEMFVPARLFSETVSSSGSEAS